jgi:hypothetical protein
MDEPQKKSGCLWIALKVIAILWLIGVGVWLLLKAAVWLFGPPQWG